MDYSFKPSDIIVNEWSSKRKSSWCSKPLNGIQVIYLPTGIIINYDKHRSQFKNREDAFLILQNKLNKTA